MEPLRDRLNGATSGSALDPWRLEAISDALSAVIEPASAGFLLAIYWNVGDDFSLVF